jgi:hypothetical protein
VHIVDIVVLCIAAVVLLGCAIILARQRFMLRAPGSLPVALRPAPNARWQYGVARYAGGELRWYRSLGFGTRPNRILNRRNVSVIGHRSPDPHETGSLPATAIIVDLRDRGTELALALSDGAYTGFVSWLESAPMS